MTGFVLRNALREVRTQARRLLLVALCIALGFAAFFATYGFSGRVSLGIAAEARAMLGADLAVSSRGPMPEGALAAIGAFEGAAARCLVQDFPTMASTGPEAGTVSRLVELRCVEAAYPLAGTLDVDPPRGPGEPWGVLVDGALAQAWGLTPGDPALPGAKLLARRQGLRLGTGVVAVQGVVGRDDTRQAAAFALGPRLYLGLGTARRLGLTGPRSRVGTRVLLNLAPGTDPAAAALALRARLPGGLRVQTREEAAAALAQPIRSTNIFIRQMGLSTLLLSCLGAWAILAAYLKGRERDAAILRCLGAPPAAPAAIFALIAALLASTALLLGWAAGAAAARILPRILGELIPQAIRQGQAPPFPWREAAAALAALALAALPTLDRLRGADPLALLRGGPDRPGRRLLAPACALGTGALGVLLVVGNAPTPRAGLWTAAGLALLFLAVFGAFRILLAACRRGAAGLPLPLKLALGQLGARPALGALLMSVIGLAVFLVLATRFLKEDLVRPLARTRGDGTRANLFFVDVQPGQIGPLGDLVRARGIRPMAAPMVRGRLTSVAGRDVEGGEGNPMLRREQNLTWEEGLRGSETVTQGRFWPASGPGRAEISLEEGFAKAIGARLGDELTFDVAGETVRGRVTSLRRVAWQTFQINFFIALHPSLLKGCPAVWIVAAEADGAPARAALQNEAARRFPNVTTVDVGEFVERVGRVLDLVALVTRALAALMLASALLVLAATLLAGRQGRSRDLALLRTLGASHRSLLASLAWEFLLLGGSAAGCAALLSWYLARLYSARVLQLEAAPDPRSGLPLVALAAALTALVGLAGSWRALQAKPMDVLRGD